MDEDDRKALAQALHEKVIYYFLNVALLCKDFIYYPIDRLFVLISVLLMNSLKDSVMSWCLKGPPQSLLACIGFCSWLQLFSALFSSLSSPCGLAVVGLFSCNGIFVCYQKNKKIKNE